MRTYLSVPFSDKDEARRQGARWDPTMKKWYVEGRSLCQFARWLGPEDKPSIREFLLEKAEAVACSSPRMKGVVPRKV